MRKIIQLFRRSERGSASIEFAVVAPVMIMLIIGIIEVGMYQAVSTMLEGGLREASRYGVTGNAANEGERVARIRQIVQNHTYGLVDTAQLSLTGRTYASYTMIGDEEYTDSNGDGSYTPGEPYTDRNGNGQWDPDSGTPGYGGSDSIVVYRVSYNWPFLTGLLRPVMGDHWTMRSAIVVRNEPF